MWTRGKKTQIWATPNFSKFFKQIQLFGPSFHRGSSQARDSLRATAMAIKRFCAAELTHFFLPVCVCTSFFDNNWWFFDNDFWFMIFDLWSCHVFHTWLGLIHQLDFFSQIGSGSSRLLVGLVFILCAGMWTTTKSSDFAVQRLPKQSAPHHDPYHDYNEAPGNPFSFEMELPNWLMEALGAGPKTGSDVNNSVLDFSSSTFAVFFFFFV